MNIEDVESKEVNVDESEKKIFDKQLELMKEYKEIENLPTWPLNLDLFEHQVIIKDFKQRGMEEIAEAIEAFKEGNVDHFKEELIDALHFFTELNLLCGKNFDFFKYPDNSRVKDKVILQTLYYNYGVLAEKYGLLCNTLKNKPWKQTQMKTDQVKFYELLKKSFEQFMLLLYSCGMNRDDIYNYYFRKHEVNKFRIESKY